MKSVYIGTSGYNYKEWREKFYPKNVPQRKWLSYYSEYFPTVEINGSFYKTLSEKTYQNWARQVGDDFQFTLKGPRSITHMKKIKDVEDSIVRFFNSSKTLSDKLKIALWQFPENFTLVNDREEKTARFGKFLFQLPKKVKQVFEFRHESWFTDDVFDLLNTYKAGFVINDTPAFPSYEKVTGNIAYIRFHGPGKLYSTSYSEEQLKVWAERIKEYCKKYDVYCYFNNDMSGYAIDNAKTLIEMI